MNLILSTETPVSSRSRRHSGSESRCFVMELFKMEVELLSDTFSLAEDTFKLFNFSTPLMYPTLCYDSTGGAWDSYYFFFFKPSVRKFFFILSILYLILWLFFLLLQIYFITYFTEKNYPLRRCTSPLLCGMNSAFQNSSFKPMTANTWSK